MKLFIAFSALFAVASASSIAYYAASPELRAYPYVYGSHSSSLVTPQQQQYHSQDEFGQYSYGYSEPHSSKQEVRSLDGTTRGSYSYRDADGKLQTVDYTADAAGFRVAATNLPRPVAIPEFRPQEAPAPVADTADVAAAREAHLAAHQEAKLRLAKSESDDSVAVDTAAADRTVELPVPVQDTVEVAAAKAEHLKRLEQEKLRNEALAARETVVPASIYHTALPVAYRSAAVYPSVYSYSYPLNSRFLASNYFY